MISWQTDAAVLAKRGEIWEVLFSENDDACVWNFYHAHLAKELKRASARLDVSVVPYQRRHSKASHGQAVQTPSRLEAQKRGRRKSSRSVVRYVKSARLRPAYALCPPRLQAVIRTIAPQHAGASLSRLSADSLPSCA